MCVCVCVCAMFSHLLWSLGFDRCGGKAVDLNIVLEGEQGKMGACRCAHVPVYRDLAAQKPTAAL